jgi:hypothetical protein
LKDKQSIDAEVLDYYEKELSDAVFSGLKIIRADSGFVEVNVKIKDEGNVDARGKVKTKVLTTLCDIASRLAGASAGVRAETISITVNIQGNEATGGNAIALAEVKHGGVQRLSRQQKSKLLPGEFWQQACQQCGLKVFLTK